MNNTQLRRLNQVTNKVIINKNVFYARMKYRISEGISCTKVFREQGGRKLHWDKKLRQQQFHPLQFDSSSRNDTILSLSRKRTTVHCFVELQKIGLTLRKIRKAPVKVRSSRLSAQSTSKNLSNVKGVSIRSQMPRDRVPLR